MVLPPGASNSIQFKFDIEVRSEIFAERFLTLRLPTIEPPISRITGVTNHPAGALPHDVATPFLLHTGIKPGNSMIEKEIMT